MRPDKAYADPKADVIRGDQRAIFQRWQSARHPCLSGSLPIGPERC